MPMKPNKNKEQSCNMLENIDLSKKAWLKYFLYLLLTVLEWYLSYPYRIISIQNIRSVYTSLQVQIDQ